MRYFIFWLMLISLACNVISTPDTSETTPSNLETFTDSSVCYRFDYAPTWTVNRGGGQNISLTRASETINFTPFMASSLDQAATGSGPGVSPASQAPRTTLASGLVVIRMSDVVFEGERVETLLFYNGNGVAVGVDGNVDAATFNAIVNTLRLEC